MKQLRLKDHLCWEHHCSMEMLPTHEYGIPLVKIGQGEGPNVSTFFISDFIFDPKAKVDSGALKTFPNFCLNLLPT